MVAMAVAMTAAMVVARRWRRRGEGAAMAAARRWRRRSEGGGDGGGKGGSRWTRQDEGAGGEEEKTVALCGAGNLASTRCGEEGSGLVLPYTSSLCGKHPFSGDTA